MAGEIIFTGVFQTQKIRYGSVMPKKEAIEKMAKAICCRENLLETCGHCSVYFGKEKAGDICNHILTERADGMEPSYMEIAKAALNALLGEK